MSETSRLTADASRASGDSVASPYRIAPLLDDPFELPGDAPGRTSDGDVWVRWANVGAYAGWYAVGTRQPKGGRSFWSKVYALATSVGNGTVDAVHAIGPGVLSLGGLSVTMSSGMAQELLHACLERHPLRWMECMAPVLTEAHALRILGFAREDPMADLEEAVRASKERSRLWVQCCSHMLRDARFDEVQEGFLAQHGSQVVGRALADRIGLGRVKDTWSWSQEQQAVWALAVVMALSDATTTEEVIGGALLGDDWNLRYSEANGSADVTLRALHEGTHVLTHRGVSEHFVSRLMRTIERLPEQFSLAPWVCPRCSEGER